MMKKISTLLQNKNSRFLLLGILIALILVAAPVIARDPAPIDPLARNPADLLRDIINFVRNILILVAVLFILFGAFTFITASGDDKKIEQGRKAILYALIAVVIAVIAHGVVIWVRDWAAGERPL